MNAASMRPWARFPAPQKRGGVTIKILEKKTTQDRFGSKVVLSPGLSYLGSMAFSNTSLGALFLNLNVSLWKQRFF